MSQTFVPDPASVGQHMADVAIELARRGHPVRVYASARGYEDASARYARREDLHGVDVRRFPLASFGKKSLPLRVLGTAVFHLQAFFAALFMPNLAGIFFSTSPPLIGLPLSMVGAFRRIPVVYWAMDLNPDQLIALGKIRATGPAARALEAANQFILRRAALIIALDRFMAVRLRARGVVDEKLMIMPPWPHESHIRCEQAVNPFRQRHGLGEKLVIMYSGNHSPSNPLQTILEAAVRLRTDPQIVFVFVGGGSGKREVEAAIEEHHLSNVLSLPYQPLSELKYSLSAADVHIVSLGNDMVGIIHPCKVYGAMAASRPILFLGPRPSHVSDLLEKHDIGFHVAHGNVDAAVATAHWFARLPRATLEAMGRRAEAALDESLGQAMLCQRFCDALERAMGISVNPALPRFAAAAPRAV